MPPLDGLSDLTHDAVLRDGHLLIGKVGNGVIVIRLIEVQAEADVACARRRNSEAKDIAVLVSASEMRYVARKVKMRVRITGFNGVMSRRTVTALVFGKVGNLLRVNRPGFVRKSLIRLLRQSLSTPKETKKSKGDPGLTNGSVRRSWQAAGSAGNWNRLPSRSQ